jgi:hypothetical protein
MALTGRPLTFNVLQVIQSEGYLCIQFGLVAASIRVDRCGIFQAEQDQTYFTRRVVGGGEGGDAACSGRERAV